MCYSAIALATDYDCWRDSGEPVSVEMVLKTFKENATKAISIIQAAIPRLAASDWLNTSAKALVRTRFSWLNYIDINISWGQCTSDITTFK